MADQVENSTQHQAFKVVFDDGNEAVFELKSRDTAKMERAGMAFDENAPTVGSYTLAFFALQRMKRSGAIDFDLPETVEELEDIADLELIEDGGAKGEGSGPVAGTG